MAKLVTDKLGYGAKSNWRTSSYGKSGYRDYRSIELRFRLPFNLGRRMMSTNQRNKFVRICINGIHRQNTGFHFTNYYGHCWHLSLDYKRKRGITLSYGRSL